MRLPVLLVLTLGVTTVTASADHAAHDAPAPVAAPAPVCEPPTAARCVDLAYRHSGCGIEQREICGGLLVELYAGPSR